MNDKSEGLRRYIRLLYSKASKLNLYACFCCKINEPDNVRLKEEIGQIKRIVSDIEKHMDCS